MANYFNKLMAKEDLTQPESYALFSQLTTYSLHQQAEILRSLAKKEETKEELLGAMDALLMHSVRVDYPHDVVDMVGTGGDGVGTFNISTAASLVVASCGVVVAKHGGRRVTSLTGSTDVFAVLGILMPNTADMCVNQLKTQGYTYLCAPLFNSLLSKLSDVRQHLAIPTILNTLGPLINPIRPKRQVLGVAQRHLLVPMAHVLKASGLHHAWVVHSDDGLDELSVSAPSTVVELYRGQIREYRIKPEDVGLTRAPLHEVIGGNSTENARIIREIFSGKIVGAKLDIVLLNSAAGLLVAGKVLTLKEGLEMARLAIASGRTATFFHTLQTRGS